LRKAKAYHVLLTSEKKERLVVISVFENDRFTAVEKEIKMSIPLLSDHLDVMTKDVPKSGLMLEKLCLACGITEKGNTFRAHGAVWMRFGSLTNPLLRLKDANQYVEFLKTNQSTSRILHLDVLKEVKKKYRKRGRNGSIKTKVTRLTSIVEGDEEASSDGESSSSDGESSSSEGESSSSSDGESSTPEEASYTSTMALLKREMDKLEDLMEQLKIHKTTVAATATRAMKENVERAFTFLEASSDDAEEYKTILDLAQKRIDKIRKRSLATPENIVESLREFISKIQIKHSPGERSRDKMGGTYQKDELHALSSIAAAVCMDPVNARKNCKELGLSNRLLNLGREYAAKIVGGQRHTFRVRKQINKDMWEATDDAIGKYCHDDNYWRVNSNQTAIRIGAKRHKVKSSNPNSNHHTYTGGSSHAIRHHLIGGVIDEQLEDFKQSHYWTDLQKQYPKAHCSSSK
jgi:hypothetical protein